jgi:hypothetical protein
MRRLLTLLLLSLLSTGLMGIGCCDCFNPTTDLSLEFSADSLGGAGFRRAEWRSAYVVRYEATLTEPIDTLRQALPGATSPAGGSYLYVLEGGSGPVAWLDSRWAGSKPVGSFRVLVPAAGRTYDLTDIDLKTTGGGGRCGCYRIERFNFSLNGQRITGKSGVAQLTK